MLRYLLPGKALAGSWWPALQPAWNETLSECVIRLFVPCRHLYCCKDIVLRRSTSGSLGFSIVGGQEEINCNQSFFIRSIVEGTPAYNDGRIRYGSGSKMNGPL